MRNCQAWQVESGHRFAWHLLPCGAGHNRQLAAISGGSYMNKRMDFPVDTAVKQAVVLHPPAMAVW